MSDFLTQRTRQCLERAGWRPQRAVDTSDYQNEVLRDRGFISDVAGTFLAEFGGLNIRYPHFRDPSYEDGCHFNASRAFRNVGLGQIAEYENVLGRRLTVIGEAFSDHMTLLMDRLGTVYGGFEDCLVKIGESGFDALNNLCEGREGERIEYARDGLSGGNRLAALSDLAVTSLTSAGWLPNRCVDLAARTGDASVFPAETNNAAKEFLKEFQGVRLTCAPVESTTSAVPNDASGGDCSPEVCEFTSDAKNCLPEGHFKEYLRKTGQTFTAIGVLDKEKAVLLMGEDGRVFQGIRELPDILWLVGESGYDAINNLCVGAGKHRVL